MLILIKRYYLSFTHGLEFEDKYKLLKGVGKVSKHLKFKKAEDVDIEILGYYVRKALEIDSKQILILFQQSLCINCLNKTSFNEDNTIINFHNFRYAILFQGEHKKTRFPRHP